jgi:hypothetical protein
MFSIFFFLCFRPAVGIGGLASSQTDSGPVEKQGYSNEASNSLDVPVNTVSKNASSHDLSGQNYSAGKGSMQRPISPSPSLASDKAGTLDEQIIFPTVAAIEEAPSIFLLLCLRANFFMLQKVDRFWFFYDRNCNV